MATDNRTSDREMFDHHKRYPISIITFEAASTRDTAVLPFLDGPMGIAPVSSDVRVYIVNELTAKNAETNDK
jgi:hypothetical protein